MRLRSFSSSALPVASEQQQQQHLGRHQGQGQGQGQDAMRLAAREAALAARSLSLDALVLRAAPGDAGQQAASRPLPGGRLGRPPSPSYSSPLALAPGQAVLPPVGRPACSSAGGGGAGGGGCQGREAAGWEVLVENVLVCCLLLHCLTLLAGAAIPGMAGGRWDAAHSSGSAPTGTANMLLALLLLLHYAAEAQLQASRMGGRRGLLLRQAASLLTGGTAVLVMLASWGCGLLAAVR
jgi:hypothetical protein